MGVIATEVAALEKQYAEATERASRLEKELAAARARPVKTVGECVAEKVVPAVPHPAGRGGNIVIYDANSSLYNVVTNADSCGFGANPSVAGFIRQALAAAIDKAIADEREACAKVAERFRETDSRHRTAMGSSPVARMYEYGEATAQAVAGCIRNRK